MRRSHGARCLRWLAELNKRTYAGTPADLDAWRRAGLPKDNDFDQTARLALAVFLDLAEKSVTRRLPLKLDY
jgi:hypothetical protein